MIRELHFSYPRAAICLAVYCFGRFFGAISAGSYPGSATITAGTAAGGIAWAFILGFEDDGSIFEIASFLLGLTETVTGVDALLKIESSILGRSLAQTQIIFRMQLMFTCIGVFVAYMGGGFLYEYVSIDAVGYVCVTFTVMNLGLLALVFWHRPVYRRFVISLEDFKYTTSVEWQGQMSSTPDCEQGESQTPEPEQTGNGVKGSQFVNHLSERQRIVLLVSAVFCFFFTTIGISIQFSIAMLYWNDVWNISPGVVGFIMGVGELSGVLLLAFLAQPVVFNSCITRNFGKPLNIVTACLGVGAMCLLTTAPNIIACGVGTVAIHMCNVAVHSFQAEIVGTCTKRESFAKWISWSYGVKRISNAVCVLTSLIFYGYLGPQASYLVFGLGLALYGVVLGCIYLCYGLWPFQTRKLVTAAPPPPLPSVTPSALDCSTPAYCMN